MAADAIHGSGLPPRYNQESQQKVGTGGWKRRHRPQTFNGVGPLAWGVSDRKNIWKIRGRCAMTTGNETVRVEFDPPKTCQETEKSWQLSAEGQECLSLPKSYTQELIYDGDKVVAAIVSRWLAENEGLASSTSSFQGEEREDDKMSRDDWYCLGFTMAFVIRGEREPLREAGILMRKLRGDE